MKSTRCHSEDGDGLTIQLTAVIELGRSSLDRSAEIREIPSSTRNTGTSLRPAPDQHRRPGSVAHRATRRRPMVPMQRRAHVGCASLVVQGTSVGRTADEYAALVTTGGAQSTLQREPPAGCGDKIARLILVYSSRHAPSTRTPARYNQRRGGRAWPGDQLPHPSLPRHARGGGPDVRTGSREPARGRHRPQSTRDAAVRGQYRAQGHSRVTFLGVHPALTSATGSCGTGSLDPLDLVVLGRADAHGADL